MSFQDPDWITFRGQHRQLLSYPLDVYLHRRADQPDFRRRVRGQGRGYVASWEVRDDDSLWLTGLRTRPDGEGPDPGLGLLFPTAGPVAASWVNQPLLAPDVELRRFSPRGNGSYYACETHLSVWRGRLVMIEEVDGKTGRRVGGELAPGLEAVFGPEEGAFLRAAFAADDDEAPRLVYADWLDDRHDPRAALVRAAERLRRLDPEAADGERSKLREQVRQGAGDWLWRRLLGYDRLSTGVVAIRV